MDHPPDKKFPLNAEDYRLYEEVGEGVSATVHRALCIPLNETVAIKVLDLEKCNNDLDGIRREAQTMSLINHPNLLRAHCSFTTGHSLWVVMPYMAGGSCLHIMKSAYPEGLEEPAIATLLREVLKALVYLHAHGHIHRDVKAGNILIASNGAVKLADFGVSACMFDTGDRQRSRNTFVGTPCWMAPEVMQQLHGYDFKADIWSFGITALELAHGHAPFSKYPPMKVLLMTLQNAPPGLDYERDKRFSKSFKEMVATCLVKDPKKRPTSEKLLKHSFFKHARSPEYLARAILEGLAPLGERFKMLKAQEAALLVQNKALYEDKEQLSQQEYMRGISAWNFNLDDLKSQAALIQENDGVPNIEDSHASIKEERHDASGKFTERMSSEMVNHSNTVSGQEDALNGLHDLKSSLASFPMKPLQALKDCFDVGEDDVNTSPSWNDTRSDSDEQLPTKSSPRAVHQDAGRNDDDDDNDDFARSRSLPCQEIPNHKKFLSGPLIQNTVASAKKIMDNGDRDHLQPKYQSERNYSGPLLYRQRKETNCLSPEDTSEGAVIQRKGRFKVTSADVSPKGMMNCSSGIACGGSSSPMTPNLAATLLPSLQCILQQNIMQREEITKLIKYAEQISGNQGDVAEVGTNNSLQAQVSCASTREKELQSQFTHLQQCATSLVEELQNLKLKNAQLEKQLNALTNRDKRIRGMTKA